MSLVITPVPPNNGLQEWKRLISFRPPPLIQSGVNARFPKLGSSQRVIHAIESGRGPLNLDCYPVRVSAMPASGDQTMQPQELLEFIRKNINNFVDQHPDGCKFAPYEPLIDTGLWDPPFLPLPFAGAVISIDMISNHINVDDGSVVLSEVDANHWVFSTLWTPNDLGHPVSGNREFGFVPAHAGEFEFYTRGADRVTSWVDEMAAETVFTSADKLWRSFQRRVADFVNSNGGQASIPQRTWNRYDWSAIVQAGYHEPTGYWTP
jgi:hypothetical protein